jgi:hypothetical protein
MKANGVEPDVVSYTTAMQVTTHTHHHMILRHHHMISLYSMDRRHEVWCSRASCSLLLLPSASCPSPL